MAASAHSRVQSFPDWTQRLKDVLPGTKTHSRALSSTAIRPGPSDARSKSTPSLGDMAAALAPTPVSTSAFYQVSPSHDIVNTASDYSGRNVSPDTPHALEPGSEVTALSNKLIAAINYQTSLDDSLATTRLELERCREELRRSEALNREHEGLLADGTLVKRADIEDENAQLKVTAEDERQRRATVEKERKGIEQELESLTTALFEEANQVRTASHVAWRASSRPLDRQMVAAARHERDLMERKNEQLRTQLKEMDSLLSSHQQQLVELKTVMQQMGSDRDEMETTTTTNHSTTPTTPLLGTHEHLGKLFDALHLCPSTPGSDDIPPSYPTSFTHLLQPAVRTDLPAYGDFSTLLKTSRTAAPRNRSSTVPYGGLSLVGLGGLRDSSSRNGSTSSPASAPMPSPSAGSPPPAPASGSLTSSPATPVTPVTPSSAQSNLSGKDVAPLRESRFYKRVLVEDIEPTMRLEIAPGLSWLARRTIAASMSDGSLVVEPMPVLPSLRVVTCALCGERRRGDEYARAHQLRANDSENAQRYPVCKYCTNRVRATCDFLGFLRMVKDGHWRADGEEGEKSAWEESVRLRDRMFWARIGGGVVPAFVQTKGSPSRPSSSSAAATAQQQDADPGKGRAVESEPAPSPSDATTAKQADGEGGVKFEGDIFHSNEKRVSIGTTVICVDPKRDSVQSEACSPHTSNDDGEQPRLPKSSDLSAPGQPSPSLGAVPGPSRSNSDAPDASRGSNDADTDPETVSAPPPKAPKEKPSSSSESSTSQIRTATDPSSVSPRFSFSSASRSEQRLPITIPGAFD